MRSIKSYPQEIRLCRVEPTWFLDLVLLRRRRNTPSKTVSGCCGNRKEATLSVKGEQDFYNFVTFRRHPTLGSLIQPAY